MVQNTLQTSLEPFVKEDIASETIEVNDILTPTTLKTITQIFESENCVDKIENFRQNDAEGFIVPQPPPAQNKVNKKRSLIKLESTNFQGGTVIVGTTPTKSEDLTILDPPPVHKVEPVSPTTLTMKTRSSSRIRATAVVQPQIQTMPTTKTRQANIKRTPPLSKSRPGVKAAKYNDDSELSPEEAERLRVRRERNKAAAARCRKRRMDTITTLEEEVAQHELKKKAYERQIADLQNERDQLQYILEQHQNECKFRENVTTTTNFNTFAVKSEPVLVEAIDQMYVVEQPSVNTVITSTPTKLKPKRPLSLTISQPKTTVASAGIELETPSTFLANMGFDLTTSTGLTPTSTITQVSFPSVNCSSQQRTSEALNDLNTPSNEIVSLVSL